MLKKYCSLYQNTFKRIHSLNILISRILVDVVLFMSLPTVIDWGIDINIERNYILIVLGRLS